MKKIKFITFVLAVIVSPCLYGFIIGGDINVKFYVYELTFLILTFAILEHKDTQSKLLHKLCRMILISAVALIFCILIYIAVNRSSGKVVLEYETTVTDVYYRYGGTAYIIDKDGNEKSVFLNDYSMIYSDNTIEEGDTVTVKEMKGLFGADFYVIEK